MSVSEYILIGFWSFLFYVWLFMWIWSKNDNKTSFNPRKNYKRWDGLNWFGVWFFTIVYWIVFLPFGIAIGIYKLFTVRR